MALVKCKECGAEISSVAAACPKCGAPPPKQTSVVTKVVGVIVGVTILSAIWRANFPADRGAASTIAATVPQAAPPSPEVQAALDRAAKDKATGDRRRGQVAMATKSLRASMHDPASFEIEDVMLMGDQAGCYTYRAKNGFGAMRTGAAVLTPDSKLLSSDTTGFAKFWNKHCQGQSGESLVAYVRQSVL